MLLSTLEMVSTTSKRNTVVIGVCLSRQTHEEFVKKVPKSKRARSKIIDLLLQKYIKGEIVVQHTQTF